MERRKELSWLVEIPSFDAETVGSMLDFAYTGVIEAKSILQRAHDLIHIAKKLNMFD